MHAVPLSQLLVRNREPIESTSPGEPSQPEADDAEEAEDADEAEDDSPQKEKRQRKQKKAGKDAASRSKPKQKAAKEAPAGVAAEKYKLRSLCDGCGEMIIGAFSSAVHCLTNANPLTIT